MTAVRTRAETADSPVTNGRSSVASLESVSAEEVAE
jgi:hypothetical protein